ncbi:MAG: HEAT repeat domain-containing protein [Elusimicrobia bacterium]|nr:HEAT repeat domain-containing protein [Elusimicrobiota bacterium]
MLGWLKSLFGPEAPPPEPPPARPISPLERFRSAGRPAEQVTALEALAKAGGPEALGELVRVIKDLSSIHAQIAAARLLGELGGPEARAALERVAGDDFWRESRGRRLQGGGGMGMSAAEGRRFAEQDEKMVRQACRNALEKLKP